MRKPIILTIDDEIEVSNAIERDLKNQYGKDYHVLKSNSGEEALNLIRELKKRDDQVALLLTDQRMPEMEGTVFLQKALKSYPEAKKVLLTAYSDTQAAIDAINEIGLDHYLMKPWGPPQQNMYPVLDDLLDDWQATAQLPYEGIRIAGTLWSSSSHTIKDFLARCQIPYQWLDIEKNEDARSLVENIDDKNNRLPVMFFPDGSTMVAPDIASVAEKVGLQTHANEPFYDLIVVGAGPAGLAAAVYGASEGLSTLLIDKESTGGQAGTSARIENYLGFPKGISGVDLARRATAQANRLGAEIITAREVTRISFNGSYRKVEISDGSSLTCYALMIATGASWRKLDVPGIDRLTGAGVYYGASPSAASNYKGQHMIVIGGANSAGQGAMSFSKYASKVTMLVRADGLRKSMSQYLIDQIKETPNIEILAQTEITKVEGEDGLKSVHIKNNKTGKEDILDAGALFIFIGASPHSELVAEIIERDKSGFILTGENLIRDGKYPKGWQLKRDPFLVETSVPGIFAVGDVRAGSVRRVASAVGQGSVGISFVHEYLKTV